MLKNFFRRPETQGAQQERPTLNTPGPWFMTRKIEEQLAFVAGYKVAMHDVAGVLTTILAPLDSGQMNPEDFGFALTAIIRNAGTMWDFSKVDIPEIVAYSQALYSEPRHAQAPYWLVFEVARDLHLHRITEKEARQKLAQTAQRP